MAVPVLTAVSDAVWEADLVAALAPGQHGIQVVRRCVDVPDLLATAATGQARAVVLSADLRRLDGDALARLAAAGLGVVGVVPVGDAAAEQRLRSLGVRFLLSAGSPPEAVSAAVLASVERAAGDPAGTPDVFAAAPMARPDRAADGVAVAAEPDRPGQLIAVWGPTGAPGRTTLAVTLAAEVAAAGTPVLLVDGDVYGGVVAQLLGVLDESPGLAAATRLANQGSLHRQALAALTREVGPNLLLLTGIARAERWPELRPAALDAVLGVARALAPVIIADCGFCLEQDEELAFDTVAPRRNGATLTLLAAADTVLAVGAADPIGIARLVRALAELRDVGLDRPPRVVVNRLRPGAVPGNGRREIAAALERYAGATVECFVPLDVTGVDAAVAAGRTLTEAVPSSPARLAIADLATRLVGAPAGRPRSRRRPSRWRTAG